jgi:hypothetical protein
MNERMKKEQQAGFTSRFIELRQRLRRESAS